MKLRALRQVVQFGLCRNRTFAPSLFALPTLFRGALRFVVAIDRPPQYRGTRGSTSVVHRSIPPAIERAASTPCERSHAAASRLRIPWWQKRITSSARSKRARFAGISPSGISIDPSMREVSCSQVHARRRTETPRPDPPFLSLRAVRPPYSRRDLRPSVPEIRRRTQRMLFNPERFGSARAELIHVIRPPRRPRHPVRQPIFEAFRVPRLLVILRKESVVPPVAALYRRRVRAPWLMHHRRNQKSRDERAIRVGRNHARIDDLFRDNDHLPRRSQAVDGNAEASPNVRVSLRVGPLHVHDRHVGTQSSHGNELLFAHRRRNLAQVTVLLQQVAAERGIRRHERHAHR